jgi:hypothetical protein
MIGCEGWDPLIGGRFRTPGGIPGEVCLSAGLFARGGGSARDHQRKGAGMKGAMGHRRWAIPEGYIPSESHGPEPEMTSHETACILNAGDRDAHLRVMVYFEDREPAGPYEVTVPARRTLHLRFNDLEDPEPVPRDTDYASVIESDEPIIVQHTRLDSRKPSHALLTTMAYHEG